MVQRLPKSPGAPQSPHAVAQLLSAHVKTASSSDAPVGWAASHAAAHAASVQAS
jgi:hypothetical protein